MSRGASRDSPPKGAKQGKSKQKREMNQSYNQHSSLAKKADPLANAQTEFKKLTTILEEQIKSVRAIHGGNEEEDGD